MSSKQPEEYKTNFIKEKQNTEDFYYKSLTEYIEKENTQQKSDNSQKENSKWKEGHNFLDVNKKMLSLSLSERIFQKNFGKKYSGKYNNFSKVGACRHLERIKIFAFKKNFPQWNESIWQNSKIVNNDNIAEQIKIKRNFSDKSKKIIFKNNKEALKNLVTDLKFINNQLNVVPKTPYNNFFIKSINTKNVNQQEEAKLIIQGTRRQSLANNKVRCQTSKSMASNSQKQLFNFYSESDIENDNNVLIMDKMQGLYTMINEYNQQKENEQNNNAMQKQQNIVEQAAADEENYSLHNQKTFFHNNIQFNKINYHLKKIKQTEKENSQF